MNIFIVEDNPTIRRFLVQIIPTLDKNYQITGISSSVEEALLSLKVQNPDVLILDVELPDGKGFDILQKWKEENKKDKFDGQVIFATAHNHYALRAIKYSALDYLLKPINVEELKEALSKAAKQLQNENVVNTFTDTKVEMLKQNLEATQIDKNNVKNQKVVLADFEKIYLVNIDEIIRCEAEGNYTSVLLTENRKITISKPLKTFEDMLPEVFFYRIHRSHFINLNFFDFLDRKDGGTIHLKDGSVLPIALRRKDLLLDKLRSI